MISYEAPTTPPTYVFGKKPSENNAKAMNAILCSLSESEFVKVMHYESIKEIWDKPQNIYEGDDRSRGPNSKLIEYRLRD